MPSICCFQHTLFLAELFGKLGRLREGDVFTTITPLFIPFDFKSAQMSGAIQRLPSFKKFHTRLDKHA